MKNAQTATVLLDINDIKRITALKSTQSIYNRMARGFPKPISYGTRANRWVAAEVEAWIQAQIRSSRNGER